MIVSQPKGKDMPQDARGVRIAHIFGAPIYLRTSWFVFMAIVIVGYAFYMQRSPRLTWADGFIISTTVAILVATAVFVHELAHAAVGRAGGQKVHFLSMTLWGGFTKLTQGSAANSLLVSLAGPAVNVFFALAGYLGLQFLEPGSFAFGVRLASDANLAIAFFNLLPAYPLDGGHAIESLAILCGARKSTAVKITSYIGLALIAVIILLFIATGVMRTPVAIIILIYLCAYLWKNASAHLTTLKHQRAGYDPLQAKNLMRPAISFAPNTPVEVVVQSIGQDFIATTVHPQSKKTLWADHTMLRNTAGTPLAHIAQPTSEPSISFSALRYDIMEYLNGTQWNRLPQHLKQNPTTLAWQVTDTHRNTIGIIRYTDATHILNQENHLLGIHHDI